MSNTKRLSVGNTKDTERAFRSIETWANTIDDKVELVPLDANNNRIDAGYTLYLGLRTDGLVVLRKSGSDFSEVGTIPFA